jgi:hypothetical protein
VRNPAAGSFSAVIEATDANGCPAPASSDFTVVQAVPTMPQMFTVMLGLGLAAVGYRRLRRGAVQ